MKRVISLVLVLALCVTSSFAVYRVDPDSAAAFSLNMDNGIATAEATDTWYDSILQNVEWMMFDISSLYTFVTEDIYSDLGDLCEFFYDLNTKILGGKENGTVLGWLNSITEYLADTAIWLGAYDGEDAPQLNELLETLNNSVVSSISSVDGSIGYWSSLWEAAQTFSGVKYLGAGGVAVAPTGPYSLSDVIRLGFLGVGSQMSSWRTDFSNWVTSWTASQTFSGLKYLSGTGFAVSPSGSYSLSDVFRLGFLGLGSQLTTPSGTLFLNRFGETTTSTSELTFASVMRNSFLGLSSNVKAISTGSYTLSLYDSDTTADSAVTASTMGNMIHQYLDAMQDDLGALTFVLADSETVQAKKDSAGASGAATEFFLNPDSDASLSFTDIGNASVAVSEVKNLFDTGVSVGHAFDQLRESGPLEFFTSVTASNLNTVPVVYSAEDDDFVHFYDPDNSEFFELIGKGGG